MKNINKLIFATSLLFCSLVYSAEQAERSWIAGIRNNPYSCHLNKIFHQDSFTLDQIQSVINSCGVCRAWAFTELICFIEKIGFEKSKEIANLFIQNKININHPNYHNDIPIIIAARDLNTVAANFLIGLGVDVNQESSDTVLNAAIASSIKDPKKKLTFVRILLEAGANPDIGRQNPLLNSVARNLSEIIFLLLLYGANPYIKNFYKDEFRETFFYCAKDKPEVMRALQRYRLYVQKLMGKKTFTDTAELISEYAVTPVEYPEPIIEEEEYPEQENNEEQD